MNLHFKYSDRFFFRVSIVTNFVDCTQTMHYIPGADMTKVEPKSTPEKEKNV